MFRISDVFTRALSVALAFSICAQLLSTPVLAQTPPGEITIVVVEGEGAVNNVGQRSSKQVIVRVEDENKKPIDGAAVVFTLPTDGPSGEFANGEKTLIVTTDARGLAAATNLKANAIDGKLPIHVSTSYRGRTARTNVTQFNMSVPGKRAGGSSNKTLLIVLAVAGAAAAGGVVATTRNGNSAGSPAAPAITPISITPGAGTIAGAR
jgi:hypothetical protein